MKTTIDLPDELLRKAKSRAALQGRSLRSLFQEALESQLRGPRRGHEESGWRLVFGRAQEVDVAEVDAVVAADLDSIDPDAWQ